MNRPIADTAPHGKAGASRLGPEAPEDAPLDPAVERVRRKLVRFAVINLLILFGALAVVVGALFWRTAGEPAATGGEGLTEAQLALPEGARALSHQVSPEGVSLLVELADGSRQVLLFDGASGRLKARWRTVSVP